MSMYVLMEIVILKKKQQLFHSTNKVSFRLTLFLI